jgi:hypothetical protein
MHVGCLLHRPPSPHTLEGYPAHMHEPEYLLYKLEFLQRAHTRSWIVICKASSWPIGFVIIKHNYLNLLVLSSPTFLSFDRPKSKSFTWLTHKAANQECACYSSIDRKPRYQIKQKTVLFSTRLGIGIYLTRVYGFGNAG